MGKQNVQAEKVYLKRVGKIPAHARDWEDTQHEEDASFESRVWVCVQNAK